MSRRVSCIPSTDSDLCDAASTALLSIDAKTPDDEIEFLLCELLIHRYPLVDVHRQSELARSGDQDVWYVYRDGRPAQGGADDPNPPEPV